MIMKSAKSVKLWEHFDHICWCCQS